MIMGALWHHLEHVFSADDRHQPGFGIAVDGGEEHVAARFDQMCTGPHDGGRVWDVLEHLHTGDDVILLWMSLRMAFYRLLHVGHLHTAFQRMQSRHLERFCPHIQPGH
ncbi:hypothetical protein D3C80_1892030 [compost metagenome]